LVMTGEGVRGSKRGLATAVEASRYSFRIDSPLGSSF